MKLRAGTSGYSFKEWKGAFYPENMKNDAMLGFYATKFPTVEINNTFYRLPKENVLLEWAAQVPEEFSFAIKASQRITHYARLKAECQSAVEFLLSNTNCLAARCGPILFQLPPNLKKDADRLRAFLSILPTDRRFAIEFRNDTWFDDETYDQLHAHDVALVVTEQEDFASPVVPTASWGYARLHRPDYDEDALVGWARKLGAQPWEELYVFFKHDHAEGSGPPAVESFVRASRAAQSPNGDR